MMRHRNQPDQVTAVLSRLGLPLLALLLCVSCEGGGSDDSQELHLFYADSGQLTAVSQDQYRLTLDGFSDQQYYAGPESEGLMAVGRFFTDEWGVRFASENPITAVAPVDQQGNITGIYYVQTSSAQYDAPRGLLSFDAEWAGHTNTQPGSGTVFGNLLLILSSDYRGNPEPAGARSVAGTKELIAAAGTNNSPAIDEMIALSMAQLEAMRKDLEHVGRQMQDNLAKIKALQQKITAAQKAQEALINANGGKPPTEGAARQNYERLQMDINDYNSQVSTLSTTNQKLQVLLQNSTDQYKTQLTEITGLISQQQQMIESIIRNLR
ncbi:MAG: hypothetical protein KKE37_09060 [Verrucomicrobia bacterium]|nr:hypothetical protein [Verrucomicrobiota bacterium]MBU4291580.1 hypothetical protein [Verrucomicrobiota bacterium]MBU4429484.1 hypothetical protein [Verrucomicrobiota bacterium]MCG2679811.1 hypothetical protein [Kiritimatiellia bacterium]